MGPWGICPTKFLPLEIFRHVRILTFFVFEFEIMDAKRPKKNHIGKLFKSHIKIYNLLYIENLTEFDAFS